MAKKEHADQVNEIIHRTMKKKGLSNIEELSEEMGLNKTTLMHYKQGNPIKLDTLKMMSEKLEIPYSDIIWGYRENCIARIDRSIGHEIHQ